uniref:Sulfide:quinone oxidoreductase, mitochondrial n=1 Tax=Meloidogyne floridensis TaxID=298350 RepID=A0A915NJJ8_9BILA
MKFSIILAKEQHYRLIVVGGGTGGCAIASKISRLLPSKQQQIAIIEPNRRHFYQPGLTLLAAGLMKPSQLIRNEYKLIPEGVDWVKNAVRSFSPAENRLTLNEGDMQLTYDYMVIATGLELRYDLIEGLPHGQKSVLEAPGVCSIYFPDGAIKTLAEIKTFSKGQNAIFSFPNTPIKCGGAPQKICYLAEDIFRENGVREGSRVIYYTSLGAVFGVPKYSNALMSVIKDRGIELFTRLNLAKVQVDKRIATFQTLDENGQIIKGKDVEFKYNLLHIGAPCSPVSELRNHAQQKENNLTDAQGFVKVDPKTLQSPTYKNIFAIGDCANTPNAKTAAAVSSQLKALFPNLLSAIEGNNLTKFYDGYSSCPLLVDRKHVILAEFTPNGPLETFPFDQSKPRRISYLMKRYLMPPLYWLLLVRGYWLGPERLRKLFHPFTSSKTTQ